MNIDTVKESVRLMDKATLETRAKSIIRGEKQSLHYMEALAKRLKNEGKNNLASELYFRMIDEEPNMPLWRKELAVCLYKDADLPADIKFDAALDQLAGITQLSSPELAKADIITRLEKFDSSEYLGVTAAVFKRKWQHGNQFKNLLYAEHFYKKGMDIWMAEYPEQLKDDAARENLKGDDAGYCAINYAFICDLIALLRTEQTYKLSGDKPSGRSTEISTAASGVRRGIIRRLTGLEPEASFEKEEDKNIVIASSFNKVWAYATLAEAFIGLDMYDKAKACYRLYYTAISDDWREKVRGINNEDEVEYRRKVNLYWQLRTTAEQLTWLADLKIRAIQADKTLGKSEDSRKTQIDLVTRHTNECLEIIFPGKVGSVNMNSINGKMGLALSGGGFRASIYHIGVLAALAEHDMLRHVEVLSCVSGGSILGAYYYLLLRNKYNEKKSLGHQDYIDIVKTLETDFLEGVQKNIRSRIFSGFTGNLKMFFRRKYTRTHRLGELYEKYLYSKVTCPGKPVYISDLKILPYSSFNPKSDNWSRPDKIPMLVLNATTLNTGHNWQFTVSWMGEPPSNIRQDVDVKKRLRRMYYDQAPAPYKKIRLGQAVGASSCVPALFAPVSMPGLYPGMNVQLVDGGVHDNQGIVSILDQECKVVIVSDASAQMPDSDSAATGQLPVFMRSDSIFQERMREGQLMDLKARENATQIKALGFVHLKKDLRQNPVNWTDSDEPSRRVLRPETPDQEEDMTSYGIPNNVQEALSKIRTDLDSFHDAEAYALMYSGYRQTCQMLTDEKFDYLYINRHFKTDFKFKEIRAAMEKPHLSNRLVALLNHSSKVLFKWYHVAPLIKKVIRLTAWIVAIGVAIYGISAVCSFFSPCVCGGCGTCALISLKNYAELLIGVVLSVPVASLVIAGFWRLYLACLDSVYARAGRLDKFVPDCDRN
jgi:predicted acylesterase/phospholipase RssA